MMFRQLGIVSAILLLVACDTAGDEVVQPPPEITSAPTEVTVGNITCHSCVATVERLLGERPGVEIDYVDLTDQQLTLHLAAGVDLGAIRQTLDSKDHPVGPAKALPPATP